MIRVRSITLRQWSAALITTLVVEFSTLSLLWAQSIAENLDPAEAATAIQTEATVDFAHDIEPLLESRCMDYHGPDDDQGGVRFDQRSAM